MQQKMNCSLRDCLNSTLHNLHLSVASMKATESKETSIPFIKTVMQQKESEDWLGKCGRQNRFGSCGHKYHTKTNQHEKWCPKEK